MTFTTRKAAAVAAAAALTMAGLPGVAGAQTGGLDSGSLGLVSDSLEGGSLEIFPEDNATGEGSLDTSGSTLLGEPTTGSFAPLTGSLADNGSVDVLTPAEGTGSVDTSGSALIGEPTTGSLAPLYAPVAGSLGIGDGATTVIEDPAVLIPVVLVGATVAAAVTFAPQIQQALLDAGIVLPPLPGLPAPAGAPAPAPAPPAPGPAIDNGRG
ncbi:hypothetical protein [Dietzia lutea]|uniref:Secreted protein n=1 Tax=Dietzia lutea TaxID=546160 RepID=A0A2S1RCW1_9ACTN|nr:hypothetical protein [Dietzia lutea]AWH91083.1 hypothetical protein A6035_01610 [Dietzia lutea]AWH91087.1 hypothetical protein A6035_01640 [Dietzia lutea]AWH94133.1 hypothetical protein A6035_17440 [Dietzia lutea]AWH94138.1 hypothetical protein A6035_17470 [Dietzia lutea]AWH94143.1 hypothetical protein A6035_17505 [Dietzia lutea]